MALVNYALFCALSIAISSAYLTTKCRDTSPECLKESLQAALPIFVKGDPKIGTESMDPFVINKLVLMLPGNLQIDFRQGTSKGLKKCIVESASLVEDNAEMTVRCNLTIKGKYKTFGKLLMFTLDGDGDSLIKCKDIRIKFQATIGTNVGDDGKKHLEIKSFKTEHSYDGQVFYRMTNLIKGNPQISDLVMEFMNRNWRLVAEEFGDPIVDFGTSSVIKNIKKLLKAVPLDELIATNN